MSGTGNSRSERSDLATIDFPYLQILIFNLGISTEVRKLLRGHEEELSKEGRYTTLL